MTPEEIPDFLQRYLAAVPAHDAAALASFHTENGTWQGPAAGLVRGRTMIEESCYRSWFTAFPDLTLEVKEQLTDGYRAVQLWELSGTHEGTFFGVDGTGKQISFDILTFYRFEQDGIAAMRFFYDFAGALLRLGALKAKPT